jgi:hypothetical protein
MPQPNHNLIRRQSIALRLYWIWIREYIPGYVCHHASLRAVYVGVGSSYGPCRRELHAREVCEGNGYECWLLELYMREGVRVVAVGGPAVGRLPCRTALVNLCTT